MIIFLNVILACYVKKMSHEDNHNCSYDSAVFVYRNQPAQVAVENTALAWMTNNASLPGPLRYPCSP